MEDTFFKQLDEILRELRARDDERKKGKEGFGFYDLDGRVINISKKSLSKLDFLPMYEIPVRVIKEYSSYILAEVLPHINERGIKSKPYTITIHKSDLKTGDIFIDGKVALPCAG